MTFPEVIDRLHRDRAVDMLCGPGPEPQALQDSWWASSPLTRVRAQRDDGVLGGEAQELGAFLAGRRDGRNRPQRGEFPAIEAVGCRFPARQPSWLRFPTPQVMRTSPLTPICWDASWLDHDSRGPRRRPS